MLFVDHDLWWFIGDMVQFFYFKTSVISLIKKVRNPDRTGFKSEVQRDRSTKKVLKKSTTLDFMFRVNSSNSNIDI